MILLALDLGQTIGFVKGDIVGPLEHGDFDMPATTDLGKWLRGSDGFFRRVIPGVSAIAVEQPFLGDSYYPARKLLALLGHVAYWAGFFGVNASQWSEIPIATGKSTLAGNGRADKDQMIAAAAERGYPGLSEHAADALGIFWVWQFGKREPVRPARSRSSNGVVIAP